MHSAPATVGLVVAMIVAGAQGAAGQSADAHAQPAETGQHAAPGDAASHDAEKAGRSVLAT